MIFYLMIRCYLLFPIPLVVRLNWFIDLGRKEPFFCSQLFNPFHTYVLGLRRVPLWAPPLLSRRGLWVNRNSLVLARRGWPVCFRDLLVFLSPVLGLQALDTLPRFLHRFWGSKLRSVFACRYFIDWAPSIHIFHIGPARWLWRDEVLKTSFSLYN